jgi:hypothetical protein
MFSGNFKFHLNYIPLFLICQDFGLVKIKEVYFNDNFLTKNFGGVY